MSSTLAIVILIVIFLIFFLKIWNKYARKYNYKILTNSLCKNCGEVLGSKSLEMAISKLDKEKEQMKKEAIGTVKLHNMELVCYNCGTVNLERDLYRAKREKKIN